MKREYPLFSEKGKLRRYGKGQILLYQGEKTNDISLVKNGYVKVYDITSSGEEKLLMILGKCDLIPQIWSFEKDDNEPVPYFYEAHSDVELLMLSQKQLTEKLNKDHTLTKIYLKYFINQAKTYLSRIECLEASGTKNKIALVLMYLAKIHGKKKPIGKIYTVLPHVTHQVIANMAGISRETTSLQMKKLEREKIVLVNKEHHLDINIAKLNKLLKK